MLRVYLRHYSNGIRLYKRRKGDNWYSSMIDRKMMIIHSLSSISQGKGGSLLNGYMLVIVLFSIRLKIELIKIR